MGGGSYAWGETKDDVLTSSSFTATKTSYESFSNVNGVSGAIYAGQSAKSSGGGIQLRSRNSNSGIVTTTTGGLVKSISIVVESGSNTLDVYGSHTPYTSAADLYKKDKQGTKLGSLSKTGEITLDGSYEYVGLRSSDGALYLTSITIKWETGVAKVLKSIAVSGTPTKKTYFDGEAFDPTGLVVTATYDDESTEVVTSRVKWTFDPATLAVGTTSVEVMASIGSDAISDVYIVNGITVKEKMILVGNSIVVAEDTKNSKWVAMSTSNINGDKTDYFESVDLVKVGDKYITTGKLDDILFYVNTVDGKTSIQNPADNKYVQATGEKKVSYTEKEYLWSNNGEQLAAAQTAHGTLQYNVAAPRFTTYAKKVGQYATIVDKSNVYEGAVIALSGTDGTHYFTTFSSDKAVEFVDATVYTVGVNENKLSLNEVKGNQVPANTGVLVQSNKTDAMYVYIESAPAIEGNLLRASVTEQTTTGADDTKEYKYYMLSYNKDNENLGFYWGENDGAAFTSKAGRAYLAVEKTNEVAAVKGFSLSDMETGISQVCGSAANNGVIYDLQGRRVERAVRGLYIMNGRKVMVK